MASFIVLLVAWGALFGLCLGQPNCALLNVPANLTSPVSGKTDVVLVLIVVFF